MKKYATNIFILGLTAMVIAAVVFEPNVKVSSEWNNALQALNSWKSFIFS